MKFNFLSATVVLGLITLLTFSCKKDDNKIVDPVVIVVDSVAQQNSEIMSWMYNEMKDVYFWNYTLPTFSSLKNETDPESFYKRLIYSPEDRWSWLTKDYTALEAEFAGTPTSMGISPVFGKFTGSSRVFIVIAFTYPGSPADKVGLKRGDIILKINDQDLDTSNYSSLYKQDNFTLNLGVYDGVSITPSANSISLSAEIIDSNPIVYSSVLEYNGHKIGYMVYTEFISGTNNSLLDDLGLLMDNFKNQGITDLVVDLRYNPGGEITAANYLASCLAPSGVVSAKEVLIKFVFNSGIQQYYIEKETTNSPHLVNRFIGNGHNLNLSRIFFLTGNHSASASELLMIGLAPYMEVIKIGEQTYGKFTGAWVRIDMNNPPKHNWAIVPIVSKYSNSVGFTDFKDGLIPDYQIDDNLIFAKPFGDIADPMLTQAVELITGQSIGLKKAHEKYKSFERLSNPSESMKYNLYLPKPDFSVIDSE
jgi:C-terminal processing protease CtpA/Prc